MNGVYFTPDDIERRYEALRHLRPFKRWKLPESDDVIFHITMSKTDRGEWFFKDGKHNIRLSNELNRTTYEADKTLMHEMCHVRQYELGVRRENHGKVFSRLADQVCRIHVVDRGMF